MPLSPSKKKKIVKVRVKNIVTDFEGEVDGEIMYHPFGSQMLVKVTNCFFNGCAYCAVNQCIGKYRPVDSMAQFVKII